MNDPAISLQRQLRCAKRELSQRLNAYPRWVKEGRMTAKQEMEEIAAMRAIVHTLERLCKEEAEYRQPSLFGE